MAHGVCVLGDLLAALPVGVQRLLAAGESTSGEGFEQCPGGRGAAQAVAAARLGARVDLIGVLEADGPGAELRSALLAEGVGLGSLVELSEAATAVGARTRPTRVRGAAGIGVASGGALTPEQVEAASAAIVQAQVLLARLEPSDATLRRAFELARAAGALVVLEGAPGREVPAELLSLVDVLVVDPHSGPALARVDAGDCSDSGLLRRLGALGPGRIVLRAKGGKALTFDGEQCQEQAALPAAPVDSCAAADAYCAALATALAEGQRFDQCLRFAAAAAALSTEVQGGPPHWPRREEVDARLHD
jgi:ribokinase